MVAKDIKRAEMRFANVYEERARRFAENANSGASKQMALLGKGQQSDHVENEGPNSNISPPSYSASGGKRSKTVEFR